MTRQFYFFGPDGDLSFDAQVLAAPKPIKICGIGPMTHTPGKIIMRGFSTARDKIYHIHEINVCDERWMIKLTEADTDELQSVADAMTVVERVINVDKVDFFDGELAVRGGPSHARRRHGLQEDGSVITCMSTRSIQVPSTPNWLDRLNNRALKTFTD